MSTKTKSHERHVTLLLPDHDNLRELAKLQKRSMRQCVAKLVEDELKRVSSDGRLPSHGTA